jgi:hypothetical protein
LHAKFKILSPKYRKPFGIGLMLIENFFLRMTDNTISQNIDLSSWNTLEKDLRYLTGILSFLMAFQVSVQAPCDNFTEAMQTACPVSVIC